MIPISALLLLICTGQEQTAPDSVQRPGPLPAHSPTGALLRSTVLPGWGQFYNEKYIKGVVLGVAETGLLTMLLLENSAAGEAREDYLESGSPSDEEHYLLHRQRRLDLIWYTSAAWLYGMMDAYVDGHLFYFGIQNRRFDRDAGIEAGVVFTF